MAVVVTGNAPDGMDAVKAIRINAIFAQTAAQRWIWRNSMTREEAIRILDPETAVGTLAEIEYYGGFRGRTKAAQSLYDACILAVAALREQEEREKAE